ncbi:MAG TPA: SPOR domain-containing protein [Pyrinomonadaceae bacterium]|nr:SPOR domain-containing protein [Pyrinomonadaceae bacterium]
MRIVCPKCELKGQVDAAPTGAKTRIACVRCATTFDAVFVEGENQALVSEASLSEATFESGASGVSGAGDMPVVSVESASTQETPHEDRFNASAQVEESHVRLEDFSASSPELMLEETVETQQHAPQEISDELSPQLAESWANETTKTGEQFVAEAQSLKSGGVSKVHHVSSDAYGIGVRLMRVSPVWLLLVGLGFISFIVFCNWLIKPTQESGDMARTIPAVNNQATNQTANRRVVAPASTAQSPADSQVGTPSDKPGVAFIAAEAREAIPTVAPKVEAVEAKPTPEAKPVVPASSTNHAGGAKEGKVTIQIGSYNVATEAEERVAKLKSAGFEARSVRVEIPQRGTWYRVQSGRFVGRDEAERYGKQLREKGVVSSFITTDVQE